MFNNKLDVGLCDAKELKVYITVSKFVQLIFSNMQYFSFLSVPSDYFGFMRSRTAKYLQ